MYLISNNVSECTGCGACVAVCAHNALTMMEEKDGFIVPVKDTDRCINCALCERICPVAFPNYSNSKEPQTYAAYDPKERKRSSSGGVFYSIAKYVINKKGIVFGAAFDENLMLRHIGVDKLNDLEKLRGSKYVQSRTEVCYKEVLSNLKNDRLVYFAGTPCQVAGLKAFLRKQYTNLITSDLVCHGVPSQRLFNSHLEYLSKKNGSKVTDYSFRDTKYWFTRELAQYADKRKSIEYDGNQSPYLYAFGLGLCYRESCYDCKFACLPRQGDITLADYWGIGKQHPEIDDRGGVSMMLVNSSKGMYVINSIKNELILTESTLEKCTEYNPKAIHPSKRPVNRDEIMAQLRAQSYSEVVEQYFQCPESMRDKCIEKSMRLRKLGIMQMLDWAKLIMKRVIAYLGINNSAYVAYARLRKLLKL